MKPHTMAARKQHHALFRRYLDFEALKNLFSGMPTENNSKDSPKRQPSPDTVPEREMDKVTRRGKSKSVDLDQLLDGADDDMMDPYELAPDTDLSALRKEVLKAKSPAPDTYESVPPCSINVNNGMVEVQVEKSSSIKTDNGNQEDNLYETAPATNFSFHTGGIQRRKANSMDTYESVPEVRFELGMLDRELDAETDSCSSTPPSSLDLGMLSRISKVEGEGLSSSQSCVTLPKYRSLEEDTTSKLTPLTQQSNKRMHKSVSLSSEVHDKRVHTSALVTQLIRQFESSHLQSPRSTERPLSFNCDSPTTPVHVNLIKTKSDSSGRGRAVVKSLSLEDGKSVDASRLNSHSFSFEEDSGRFTASSTPFSPKNSLESTYESISGYNPIPPIKNKLQLQSPPAAHSPSLH